MRIGRLAVVAFLALNVVVLGKSFVILPFARRDADRIVAALDRYKADHQYYPQELDELVPRYLAGEAPAGRFRYQSADGDCATLSYDVAPFVHALYRTNTRRWIFIS
jgi:hypothetical protein